METNLSFPRYLTQYLGAKVTTGYCDPDEILADTNECLSDTTVIISEFIKVKLRNSFENINYSPFLPGWTKLCNMHQGGVKFKLFSAGSVFTGPIFTEEVSRVDSARAVRQSVVSFTQSFKYTKLIYLSDNCILNISSLHIFLKETDSQETQVNFTKP